MSIFAGLLFARVDMHQIHCKITHWLLNMELHSGCILQGSSPAKYTFENSTPLLFTQGPFNIKKQVAVSLHFNPLN
jgi:hypothetical protein